MSVNRAENLTFTSHLDLSCCYHFIYVHEQVKGMWDNLVDAENYDELAAYNVCVTRFPTPLHLH